MTTSNDGASPRAAIDEGFFADVRGEPQWITLRGADPANTALLILGGAGAALSRMAPFFAPWEAAFTLVQWDQPGAGATYARNGEAHLSLDRLAADAATVAEVALTRLGARKLAVLGISGGSMLGLKLAKARPDLVSAYVGTGQIVHWARQQTLGYRLTLEAAQSGRNLAAVADLERIGPPPHPDLAAEMAMSQYANTPTDAERRALGSVDLTPPTDARYLPAGLVLPDPRERALAAYAALRGEIARFDARALGRAFEMPLFFLQGDEDRYTPTPEVAAYAGWVEAPAATVIGIPGGGHSAVFLRDPVLTHLKQHLGRSPFETLV